MIYIYRKPTGPYICSENPDLVKKLEPLNLIIVDEDQTTIRIERKVNNSVFIADVLVTDVAKDASGNKYGSLNELITVVGVMFANYNALLGTPEPEAPAVNSQYATFTDPETGAKIRMGIRNGESVTDKTITELGFDGVKDTDWEEIGGIIG